MKLIANKRSYIEFFELILYLILAAILVYYVPTPLNKILFIGLIVIAWRSKRDYLWVTFFFVINDTPAGLFSGGERTDMYRLPLYTFAAGASITVTELYLLLLLLKVKVRKLEKPGVFFSKDLRNLAVYFIILSAVSIILGMSFDGFRQLWRMTINLTLFYTIFFVINSSETLVRFLRVIFPFAILALSAQFYSLVSGHQLITLFKPDVISVQGVLAVAEGAWARPIEMPHVLLVCFTGSLYLLGQKKAEFSSGYLVIINIISFISIFLTGTRSWFIAFSSVYVLYFVIMRKQIAKQTVVAGFGFAFIFVLLRFTPVLDNQFHNAWSRLETIERFIEGDITAGGTAMRFDQRSPRVMKGFNSSTILFGAGFSDHYLEYADGHVGYHNLLLNTGILGVLLFISLLVKILLKSVSQKKKSRQPFALLSLLPLIALLILNTGVQVIGYTTELVRIVSQGYALAIVAIAYNEALNDTVSNMN